MGIIRDFDEVYKIYSILYPFIKKYGATAYDVLKSMIDADIHPQDLTQQVLENSLKGVEKVNQEIQNA